MREESYGLVVPLFRGSIGLGDVNPLQMFSPDWMTKKECARRLGRSERWVQQRMRDSQNPIPHKKMDERVKQSAVMFPIALVDAWWHALGQNVGFPATRPAPGWDEPANEPRAQLRVVAVPQEPRR